MLPILVEIKSEIFSFEAIGYLTSNGVWINIMAMFYKDSQNLSSTLDKIYFSYLQIKE